MQFSHTLPKFIWNNACDHFEIVCISAMGGFHAQNSASILLKQFLLPLCLNSQHEGVIRE